MANAVSPYPYAALASFAGVSDPLDLLKGDSALTTDVARDLEFRRTVSRIVIPSSRALLTSECARYATSELGAVELDTRMEDGSGVMMRYTSGFYVEQAHSVSSP